MRRILFSLLSFLFVAPTLYAQDALEEQSRLVFENIYFNALQAKIKGDYNGAFEMFMYLQKQQPDNPAVLNEIAKLLNATQDYTHAAEFAQRAVDVDTTNNRTYIETATSAYVLSGHQEKVLPLYETILAANPDDVDTRYNKYTLLSTLGRYDEALNEAKKIKTNDPKVLYEIELRRVAIYAEKGEHKKALKLATVLDKSVPNQPRTLYVISHLYKMKGDTDKSINLCERATQCPNGSPFFFLLADLYKENKMDSLYAHAMLQGFASDEIDENAKVQQVYQLMGDKYMLNDANWMPFMMNTFSSLLQQYPINTDIVSLAESYLAQNGRYKLGNDLLTRFVADARGTEYIWNRLISYALADTLLSATDKANKMIDLCSRALNDVPTNPLYGIVKGEYQCLLKDYKSALNTFNQVFAFLDGLDANQKSNFTSYRHSALNGIANCYQYLDSISKAFIVYDQILSEDPDDEMALNNYAYFLAKRGLLLDKAERMSMRSLNRDPLNATFLDTYAYVLLREAKYQEAMFVMERCIENYSKGDEEPSADIHDHYGDILFNVGKVDEAIEQWQKALSLEPDNALIKRKIDEKKYIVDEIK